LTGGKTRKSASFGLRPGEFSPPGDDKCRALVYSPDRFGKNPVSRKQRMVNSLLFLDEEQNLEAPRKRVIRKVRLSALAVSEELEKVRQ
jgi:hypothetical protein